MMLGTKGLLAALSCQDYKRRAVRASEALRVICHADPFVGAKVGKGRRRKLAINLWPVKKGGA